MKNCIHLNPPTTKKQPFSPTGSLHTTNSPPTTTTPFAPNLTLLDIQDGAQQRSPNKSSPGIDGLPYEILTILFNHTATSQLALQVYNDALEYSILYFPPPG